MKLVSGLKLKCSKTFGTEKENYGIDCIEGKEYIVLDVDEGGAYFSAENGSHVALTWSEIYEYFGRDYTEQRLAELR